MNYLISKDIKSGLQFGGTIIDMSEYLDGINVHGSIEHYHDKYYVAYHKCVPGMNVEIAPGYKLSLTREMSMEEITIEKDGRIKQTVPSSSGIRGGFHDGEKIYAASAVFFSEIGGENRFISRGVQNSKNKNVYTFLGFPYAYFSIKGQYYGFRYIRLDFCQHMTLCIKTVADGAVIHCIDTNDNAIISSVKLPNTKDEWMEIQTSLAKSFSGKKEFKIELIKEPKTGCVKFDWIRFDL